MLLSGTSHTFNVLVNGKTAREYSHPQNTNTYIEGRSGSKFSLYFKNNSYQRVLVVPSVDGLSVMDGKPASNDSDGYVVDAWSSLEVPGWRINKSKVGTFKFCPQGDVGHSPYVEELAREGFNVNPVNQGVIGLMIFDEMPQAYAFGYNLNLLQEVPQFGQMNYYDKQVYRSGEMLSASSASVPVNNSIAGQFMNMPQGIRSLGAGFGEDKSFHTVSTYFNKKPYYTTIGVIYYDTLINLRRKGVMVDAGSQTQNAFPGMNDGCYTPNKRA